MKYLLILAVLISGCGTEHHYIAGPKGDPGLNGQDGAIGTTGPQGNPGVDATPVTIVKLCPGSTIYPSTFVEVAFCINNKLYAVYSTNGGFESEIPPGSYNSNGVNSTCTFTVTSGCVVQ